MRQDSCIQGRVPEDEVIEQAEQTLVPLARDVDPETLNEACAAVGRDLVIDAGHEILGEAVRLEVVAVGLGRPWRVEARQLDGMDGRQILATNGLLHDQALALLSS